jgi:general stress protein 26
VKLERERAQLPGGYSNSEKELLEWGHVDQRMRNAKHYWLCTLSPQQAPHIRPVAGMWLDGRLYFGGSPLSRWAKNLDLDPRVCINLSEEDETSDRAVILHGHVATVRPDRALAAKLVSASNEKYAYEQTVDQYEGNAIFEFTPEMVLAWTELANATRWRVS